MHYSASGFLLCALVATVLRGSLADLSIQTTPRFEGYPQDTELDVSAVVSIVAPESTGSIGNGNVALSAVMDRSGSMRGDPISLVKRSLEFLAQKLKPLDYFGLVSYATDARGDLPMMTMQDHDSLDIESTIENIEASGSTNLAGGLLLGVDQMINADLPSIIPKNIFLFSDGLANVGVTDVDQVINEMNDAIGEADIQVTTFAFGDADRSYMQQIAEAGRGDYYFIQEEAQIAEAFGKALGGLLSTVAQDIQVTLTPLNGAMTKEVLTSGIFLDNMGDSGSQATRLLFINLFAGERRDIYVDLAVPPTSQSVQDVLRVEVVYISESGEQKTETTTLAIVREPEQRQYQPQPIVEITLLRFETAQALEEAAMAEDTQQAINIIQQQQIILQNAPVQTAETQAIAQSLAQAETQLTSGEKDDVALTATATSLSGQRNVGSADVQGLTAPVQDSLAQEAVDFVGGGDPSGGSGGSQAGASDSGGYGGDSMSGGVLSGGYGDRGSSGSGGYGSGSPSGGYSGESPSSGYGADDRSAGSGGYRADSGMSGGQSASYGNGGESSGGASTGNYVSSGRSYGGSTSPPSDQSGGASSGSEASATMEGTSGQQFSLAPPSGAYGGYSGGGGSQSSGTQDSGSQNNRMDNNRFGQEEAATGGYGQYGN